MTRRTHHPCRLNGFSLIELLLGVSLFFVVALTAYSTFWGGVKLSRYAEETDSSSREIRWAFDLMALEIENAVSYDFSGSYPQRSAFEGSQDRVTFILAGEKGLRAVSYYLAPPEDGAIHKIVMGERRTSNADVTLKDERAARAYYLVREEVDFVDSLDEAGAQSPSVEIIAERVKEGGLKFAYGYTREESFIWKDTWQKNVVPRSVRVMIDVLPARGQPASSEMVRDILIPSGVLGTEEG